MKFLQVVVLSAICMGYVTASYLGYVGYDGLCDAIRGGRLDIAVDLGKQDEALGKKGIEDMIRKRDPDLIANFVNETNQANARTLEKLWRKSSMKPLKKFLIKSISLNKLWLIWHHPAWWRTLLKHFLCCLTRYQNRKIRKKLLKKILRD